MKYQSSWNFPVNFIYLFFFHFLLWTRPYSQIRALRRRVTTTAPAVAINQKLLCTVYTHISKGSFVCVWLHIRLRIMHDRVYINIYSTHIQRASVNLKNQKKKKMEKETTTTTDWVDEKRWCMEHSTVKICQYKQNWEGINMKYMCATVCAWIFIFILLLSYPLLPPARHKYIFFFFFKKIKVKDNLKSFVVMPRLSLGEINSAITKREQQPTIHELITKEKKEKKKLPTNMWPRKREPYIYWLPTAASMFPMCFCIH